MKNKRNNFLLSIFTFLLITGTSQSLFAQDPLVIETTNDTTRVKINAHMEVTGPVKANSLNTDGSTATFGGNLSAKKGTFSENVTINNALIGDLGHSEDWAGFAHKSLNGATDTYALLHYKDGGQTYLNIKKRAEGANPGFISFNVDNKPKMIIQQNGNVGIGIGIAPSTDYKLNVNGTVNTSGNATINNAMIGDLGHSSEWAGIAHKSLNGATNTYALLQSKSGTITLINKKEGKGYIGFMVNNKPKMVILDNGNVGIGTPDPKAPLHVYGVNNDYRYNGNMRALDLRWNNVSEGNYNTWIASKKSQLSIIAEGFIITKQGVVAHSDIRIKKNIDHSSSKADLNTLKAIEIVNYKKIDTIADNKRYKKVIAQQVKEVYPLAVQIGTQDFIPSVFQASASINKLGANEYGLSVTYPHNLAVNDIVELKCYPGNKSEQVKVSKIISPTQFEVESVSNLDTLDYVFVYGKQVDDLLSVDYDAISMLNVSATQELAKQVESLKSENQILKNRIQKIEEQANDMKVLLASVIKLQKESKELATNQINSINPK